MTRASAALAAFVLVTHRCYAILQRHHAGDGAMSPHQTDGAAATAAGPSRIASRYCLMSLSDREQNSRILSSLRCQTFAENIS
ncbi:hypothetical protein BZM27_44975 [Paraburkholderia steynii]|uniref:Uncharacterized protein n=1 Tax=Paraburkholderia steynii TaxID=1245441 RepID=A0A4V6N9C9_9BURK|nr:hypothetical protein BZM27_44975 [Paraburkholderia steynii]